MVVYAGYSGCFDEPLTVDFSIVGCNVARNRFRENHAVLHHYAALPAPPLLVECGYFGVADSYTASLDGVVAQ